MCFMGALTEREIFDQMTSQLKSAVDACVHIAKHDRRGWHYDRLRKALALVAGCCRQAAYWRGDARWLNTAMVCAQAHQRTGDWLRGFKDPISGRRIMYSKKDITDLFTAMAANLAALHNAAVDLRDKKTGKAGMILPIVKEGPHRETRPVSVDGVKFRELTSGLVVPDVG